MRMILAGGGTGGHIYPSLVVLSALKALREDEPVQALYLGSKQGLESVLVPRAGLDFKTIINGAITDRVAPVALWNLGRTLLGTAQCWQIMRSFDPDVVLATGGHTSAPAILAAALNGTPVLLHLPDLRPGLAIRSLSRFATRIAVSFDEALPYFPPNRAIATGYPVRPELFQTERDEAARSFGLDPKEPVLLIFGGSRGAHSINTALLTALPRILPRCQVIHVCGERELDDILRYKEGLTTSMVERYQPFGYLYEEMPRALAAADLVLSRAGAATLAEFPAAGLPSILVPYPHAGAHQAINAQWLVDAGAAISIEDRELDSDSLADLLLDLLDHPEKLQRMAENARRLARPDAAQRLAECLIELAQSHRGNHYGN